MLHQTKKKKVIASQFAKYNPQGKNYSMKTKLQYFIFFDSWYHSMSVCKGVITQLLQQSINREKYKYVITKTKPRILCLTFHLFF